jgi:DNA invertase Pin-like site-specific DNA recombinase
MARWRRTVQPPSTLRRAAQYVRMSTEHQQYSIANQSAALALYGAAHEIGIVRSFVDAGKIGTTIKRRVGLQELLRIVESGNADFTDVLVYDVSRWGRFPDCDESAHYEFLCKRAGISVHYCAEQFENDNSPTSNLLKALKRTMASEYSRELSVKVSAGQHRLAGMGFWQGGKPPFGMLRLVVDENRNKRRLLENGEWKSISTDRIVLTPGPKDAIETIRLAYDLYTKQRKSRREIVQILNSSNRLRGKSRWTVQRLRELYNDPVYKGAYAYAKHDLRFGQFKHRPPEAWITREHAFPAIISAQQWNHAKTRIADETKPLFDSEMLKSLVALWKRRGYLNSTLINASPETPSISAYRKHFDGLGEAYKLIGYPAARSRRYTHTVRLTRELRAGVCASLCEKILSLGGCAEKLPTPGLLFVNHRVTVKVLICNGFVPKNRNMVWTLTLNRVQPVDVTIIGRLKPPERKVLDYFIIPTCSGLRGTFQTREGENDPFLEIYRFDNLDAFISPFHQFSIADVS